MNNTCEYIHQRGEKEGDRCDKVPQNKLRRFCGKHHNYLYWQREVEIETDDIQDIKYQYPRKRASTVKHEVRREEDLYKHD